MKLITLHTARLNARGERCDAGSVLTVGNDKAVEDGKADISATDAADLVAAGLAAEGDTTGPADVPAVDPGVDVAAD